MQRKETILKVKLLYINNSLDSIRWLTTGAQLKCFICDWTNLWSKKWKPFKGRNSKVSEEDSHTKSLISNWWCFSSLVLIGSPILRSPNPGTKIWALSWYHLECGWRRAHVFTKWDFPAPPHLVVSCSPAWCDCASPEAPGWQLWQWYWSWWTLPWLGPGTPPHKCLPLGRGWGGELSWDGGRKGASFVTVFRPCPLKLWHILHTYI